MDRARLAPLVAVTALLGSGCDDSPGPDAEQLELELPEPVPQTWDALDWDPFQCTVLPDTREAVEATPRARPDIELLALHFSPGIVADAEVYDRLVADLSTIAMLEPAAPTTYAAGHDGREMLIQATAATLAAMESGTYRAWLCLNEHYGLESFENRQTYGLLRFKGTYEVNRLASLYARLPGITGASPNGLIGAGSTLHVTPVGNEWHYVADAGSGDCQAGCINHTLYYFISEPGGAVRYMERWTIPPYEPAPEWVERYWRNAATGPQI